MMMVSAVETGSRMKVSAGRESSMVMVSAVWGRLKYQLRMCVKQLRMCVGQRNVE